MANLQRTQYTSFPTEDYQFAVSGRSVTDDTTFTVHFYRMRLDNQNVQEASI